MEFPRLIEYILGASYTRRNDVLIRDRDSAVKAALGTEPGMRVKWVALPTPDEVREFNDLYGRGGSLCDSNNLP